MCQAVQVLGDMPRMQMLLETAGCIVVADIAHIEPNDDREYKLLLSQPWWNMGEDLLLMAVSIFQIDRQPYSKVKEGRRRKNKGKEGPNKERKR